MDNQYSLQWPEENSSGFLSAQTVTTKRHLPEDTIPYELLLLADPSREAINRYLPKSQLFLAYVDSLLVGCYVLGKLNHQTVEIKNIAVANQYQDRGIGTILLEDAEVRARAARMKQITIRTGNSSTGQLCLYQKVGFVITAVDRGYFVRNYPQPIIENGIACQDRITLVKLL